jgi:hypothetical protein
MNKAQFQEFEALLQTKTSAGSVVCYWNLMVDRIFGELDERRYQAIKNDRIDKGFFYKRFVAEEVESLQSI